jgi:penicillin-binding protein 1A
LPGEAPRPPRQDAARGRAHEDGARYTGRDAIDNQAGDHLAGDDPADAEWRVGGEPSRLEILKAQAEEQAAAALAWLRQAGKIVREEADTVAAAAAVIATIVWRWGKEKAAEAGAAVARLTGRTGEEAPRRAIRRGPNPWWKQILIWAGWGGGALVATSMAFMAYVTWDLPSTDDLWSAKASPSITFVDVKGRVILREGAQNAPPVDLEKLPAYVGQAVVAIEDKRFFHHWGVDFEGLSRAAVENAQNFRVVQGGSTITQQLAKNLFLTNERTFRRKAQEVALALWLEGRFSKDQILALYLSRVFFGAGAWGVEAASERYFDKPASQLTLGESALLAGLLKAPSRMNPAIDPREAKDRAVIVLNEMVAEGFITAAQRDGAVSANRMLAIKSRPPSGNLGYFREWIEADLSRLLGEERDDYIVETTLDLDAQRAGERAIAEALRREGEALNVSQGALIAVNDDGGVIAMVGGSDFEATQFNRTTQMRRQPGSAFKFYIYLAALQRGLSPYSVRDDAPIMVGDWAPANYDDEYFGSVPLTLAFAKSLNMVAIRVAQEAGHQRVIDLAKRLGVRSALFNYASLALGAQEMSLAELTQSYAAVSNGGYAVRPFGISAIRRANGNVLYQWRAGDRDRVLEDREVRGMNLLMARVVEAGTGARARLDGRQSAGKTGTTNDYKDAWFVGFSSGVTTGVWVGNDDTRRTRKVTGGSMPASIWRDFMRVALRDTPPRPLAMPRAGDFLVEAAPPSQAVAATADAMPDTGGGAPLIIPATIGPVDPSQDSPIN